MEEIGHAFAIANRAGMSEEELELQERREMFLQDQRGALQKAKKDGEAAGMEKGARNKAIEGAKKFKVMGLVSHQQIADAMGLSLAEVEEL